MEPKQKKQISLLRYLVRYVWSKYKALRVKKAVGTIDEVTSVYDDVFENDENFDILDSSNKPKLKYVLAYAKGINGQVLDAGCGRGSVLRHMLDNGIDAFGIELSPLCVSKYLCGLPVENADIVSWAKTGARYEGCISTDVMEHIPLDQIDDTLDALSRLSPSVFFGIANHSSIHNGHELHVIQEGIQWWTERVRRNFKSVSVLVPDKEDTTLYDHYQREIFFFIKATN